MCVTVKQSSVWYPDVPIFSVTGNRFFIFWSGTRGQMDFAQPVAMLLLSFQVPLHYCLSWTALSWPGDVVLRTLDSRGREFVLWPLLTTKQKKVYCWVQEWHFFKSVNIWQICKQERGSLVHFLRLLAVCWPGAQSAWDNHALSCNFAKYSPILFFSTCRPFLLYM